MLAGTATDARQTWREDGLDNARLRSAAHAGVHRQSFQQPLRGSRTHRLKKTTIAFTAALVAASASFAQVSLGTDAKAGTGATVTLPAPATGQGTAATGVGTGASVELPAPAAENGAKTEAGVKTEAAAEAKKTHTGKARKKSTTELGAGAAGNASGSTSVK